MKNKFSWISKMLLSVAAFLVMVTLGKGTASAANVTIWQSAQDANSITVNWTYPSIGSGYEVTDLYLSISDDQEIAYNQAKAVSGINVKGLTSYTVTGLKPGTKYYTYLSYRYVYTRGRNSSSYSTYTSEDLRTAPGVVTGLNQERWYRYIEEVNVAWDAQTGVDGYELIFSDHRGNVIEKKTYDSSSSTRYSHKISNKKVYKATVRAFSTINGQKYSSEWCPEAYFMVQPSNSNRDDKVAVKVKNGKMTVNWLKMDGVSGYNVYVNTKNDGAFKKVAKVNAKKKSATFKKIGKKKIKKNKTYYVYVEAFKKVGGITYTTGRNYITVYKNGRLSSMYASSLN